MTSYWFASQANKIQITTTSRLQRYPSGLLLSKYSEQRQSRIQASRNNYLLPAVFVRLRQFFVFVFGPEVSSFSIEKADRLYFLTKPLIIGPQHTLGGDNIKLLHTEHRNNCQLYPSPHDLPWLLCYCHCMHRPGIIMPVLVSGESEGGRNWL